MPFYTPRSITPADQVLFDADGNAVGIQPAGSSSPPVLGFNPTKHAVLDTMAAGGVPWQGDVPAAAGAAIALPSSTHSALWFPLNEGTGATVTDRINGKVATVGGTTTNLWDNANCATLNADTVIALRNDTFTDELLRLDTLDGSILLGLLTEGPTPTTNAHLFGYGDNSNATFGGYSLYSPTSQFLNIAYGVRGGSVNQTGAFNLSALMKTRTRRYQMMVVHRLEGRLYFDGYEGGWHSRSLRVRALESGLPTASPVQGLRIGARPVGAIGSGANHIGAGVTLARISNFFALRINGDQRHLIPGWMRALSQSLPYGVFPELTNG